MIVVSCWRNEWLRCSEILLCAEILIKLHESHAELWNSDWLRRLYNYSFLRWKLRYCWTQKKHKALWVAQHQCEEDFQLVWSFTDEGSSHNWEKISLFNDPLIVDVVIFQTSSFFFFAKASFLSATVSNIKLFYS